MPALKSRGRARCPAGRRAETARARGLGPGELVLRRFMRNKLAMAGVGILLCMFLFSFFGGLLSPYGETEIFTQYVQMEQDYAGVTKNRDYKFSLRAGCSFPPAAQAAFVQALHGGAWSFTAQGQDYDILRAGEEVYVLHSLVEAAALQQDILVLPAGEGETADFEALFREAAAAGAARFQAGGETFYLVRDGARLRALARRPVAVAATQVFDFAGAEAGFSFRLSALEAWESLRAAGGGQAEFTAAGVIYSLEYGAELSRIYRDGALFAQLSPWNVQAAPPGERLSLEFKEAAKAHILAGDTGFSFSGADGTARDYSIRRENDVWVIGRQAPALVTLAYAPPSLAHPLGTDGNGMDLLTRLMYGGRVSLTIGFLVVLVETGLGLFFGGVAGYFGKWADGLIMRLVDVFGCIPSTPLLLMLGVLMDQLKAPPQLRIACLMLVLGFLGWPETARLVRGQVLALREQEFMTAAEALGLAARRKIFRHLVPNVVPQLIVTCTMSLGHVILMESSLSFLGLGVKYPFATWGNMVSGVTSIHVMTSYLFVWLPAGLCILLTVLGFNFIGDGLRDAYDPKMKR